jgi:PHD/YefM family antitoxin component YafN of YafNO toxin-antitoxin module
MKQITTQFVINEKGEKSAVIVPMKTYLEMLEKLEELEDIRMYDAVKSRNESSVSLEEYRQKRKAKNQNALSSSNS